MATSEAFHRHVQCLSAEDLEGTRGGDEDRAPLRVEDIIQHCMNHSIYHRGQLISQGRQAGLKDPPRADLIHEVGRKRHLWCMGINSLLRWMSWLGPIRVARAEGHAGPLVVRWELGRKVLNSAHANQSFGSLHRVWQRLLKGTIDPDLPPRHVLLLGLGAGSAVHILRREMGLAMPITAVELDPVMVKVAGEHFGLHTVPGVEVLVGDAIIQVQAMKERFDLVLVDLFQDLDLARGVDTRGFAHALRERCAEDGTVLFNTVDYDEQSGIRCDRVHANLAQVFRRVQEVRTEGINRVIIARG